MEEGRTIPKRLYKYRELSARTLDMIVGDTLYFADPSTFNDPLDTRPSLKADIEEDELERVVRILAEQRTRAELQAAARTMSLKGVKTEDFIEKRIRGQADRLIAEIEYNATNPDYDPETALSWLLSRYIESELLRRYEKGIVSFAEQDSCPLLWSHYGDQHRGICIGYSVPSLSEGDVYRVEYGGSRIVLASDVSVMLNGDGSARRRVDEAVLLQKAASWEYEREWRLIGNRGLQGSRLKMEEVIFGMRCKSSAKYAIVKALECRKPPLEFYEIREERGTFSLRKEALERGGELFVHFPQNHLSILEGFENVSSPAQSSDDE